MKIELDDHVAVVRLVEGLTSVGLTISNDREGGLRIHNSTRVAEVIDLGRRRKTVAELDAAMRAGMRRLFRDEPPQGAA